MGETGMSAVAAEFPHISIAHTGEIIAESHLPAYADVMSTRAVRFVLILVPRCEPHGKRSEA